MTEEKLRELYANLCVIWRNSFRDNGPEHPDTIKLDKMLKDFEKK